MLDLRTYENKHETNPFVLELKGKMFLQPRANTIIAKGQALVDTNTGEVIDESILIGKRKIVDKSQFSKLYANDIGILYSLSRPAINVFLYLSKVMDYDNKAYINSEKDCKKIGYSTGLSVIKGLKELIKNDIVAAAVMPGWYWLNPKLVCRGERFAKYIEYVVGTEEEVEKQELLHRKQQKETINKLPHEVYQKYEKANSQPTKADLEAYQQNKEKAYFKQGNLFKEDPDFINPLTGEVIK